MKRLSIATFIAIMFTTTLTANDLPQMVSSKITNDLPQLVSLKTHVKFFSSTPAEDIESHNYKATSTIEPSTGEIIFSVPMQAFEFEKALMQKHFNQPGFLDTKEYPRARLKANIINLSDINFDENGRYKAEIEGEMTIKGKTIKLTESGTITIADSKVTVKSTFNINRSDYEINLKEGKPSTNVANEIAVTVEAEYKFDSAK